MQVLIFSSLPKKCNYPATSRATGKLINPKTISITQTPSFVLYIQTCAQRQARFKHGLCPLTFENDKQKLSSKLQAAVKQLQLLSNSCKLLSNKDKLMVCGVILLSLCMHLSLSLYVDLFTGSGNLILRTYSLYSSEFP